MNRTYLHVFPRGLTMHCAWGEVRYLIKNNEIKLRKVFVPFTEQKTEHSHYCIETFWPKNYYFFNHVSYEYNFNNIKNFIIPIILSGTWQVLSRHEPLRLKNLVLIYWISNVFNLIIQRDTYAITRLDSNIDTNLVKFKSKYREKNTTLIRFNWIFESFIPNNIKWFILFENWRAR